MTVWSVFLPVHVGNRAARRRCRRGVRLVHVGRDGVGLDVLGADQCDGS